MNPKKNNTKNIPFLLGFIATFLFISLNNLYSQQCTISAIASPQTIVCGDSVTLSAYGTAEGELVFGEDFNSGQPSGWAFTQTVTITNSTCGLTAMDGTDFMWMGDASVNPRDMETIPFDLTINGSPGGIICFEMVYSIQGQASPCEGPDEPQEGVALQYSIDGSNWITIDYWDPNGGNDASLTSWGQYCTPIPTGALTSGTQFRWHQDDVSGAAYDHWGIDNVEIFLNDPTAHITWTHDGYVHPDPGGGVNPTPVSPTSTTTYEAVLLNSIGVTCSATVTVIVEDPTYIITADPNTEICPGACQDLTGTAKWLLSPGGLKTFENNQVSAVTSGVADMNVNVQGLNMQTVNTDGIVEVCINGFNYSGTEFCTTVGGCNCNGVNIAIGSTCNLNAASFGLTLTSPNGCIVNLYPTNTVQTTNIQNMCFSPAGQPISSGTGNYTGDFVPNDDLNDMTGCTSNGNWNLEFNTGTGGLGFGTGLFLGWSITFDDPEISQPADFYWNPTTDMTNSTSLTPNVCPTTLPQSYYLVASNGIPGCAKDSVQVTITENSNCCPFYFQPITIQDPSCSNDDGIININFVNGTGPYNIISVIGASTGALSGFPINGTSNWNVTNLVADTYTIKVEDTGAGCQKDTIITLNFTPTFTYTVTTINQPDCINPGMLIINFSGLAAGTSITYQYNDGSGTVGPLTGTVSASGNLQIQEEAGTYSNFVVIDPSTGCSASVAGPIVINSDVVIPTAIISGGGNVCAGQQVPIQVVLTGTANWSFEWAIDGVSQGIINNVTTSPYTANVSVIGEYTLISVNDDSGCSGSVFGTADVSLLAGDDASFVLTDFCVGATNSATSIATPGGVFSFNPNVSDGATINSSTGAITNGLAGTTYNVQYITNGSCAGSAIESVTVIPPPIIGAGTDLEICEGESIILSANNPNNASLSWSNGLPNGSAFIPPVGTITYTVTANLLGCTNTDDIIVVTHAGIISSITTALPTICQGDTTQLTANGGTSYLWSTGQPVQTINVNPSVNTTYVVTVSDAYCSEVDSILIAVNDSVIVTVNPPVICAGQTCTLNASNGASYIWSTGETTQSIDVSPMVNTWYQITITDNGCTGSGSVEVVVNQLPNVFAGADQAICFGDNANLTATGGATYFWSTTQTGASISVSPTSTTSYTVTGFENGCENSDNVSVIVNQLPVILLNPVENVCIGESITITAGGGLSYVWNTGDTSNTITVAPINTTTYTVTATVNNCSSSQNVLVNVLPLPNADAGSDISICDGANAVLTATGGSTFLWNTGSSNSSITVSPGLTTNYSVIVSDNNCSATDYIRVTVLPPVIANITATLGVVCSGDETELTATGGTLFLWNTNDTTETIAVSPLVNSTYRVTVSENGCSSEASIFIIVNPNINATCSPDIICMGDTSILSVSSGNSYLWSTGETTQQIIVSPLVTRTYSVTVTANTCVESIDVTVTVNPLPHAYAGEDTAICKGFSIDLTATGGTNYIWSNTENTQVITVSPLVNTSYTVYITDINGCKDNDDIMVIVNENPNIFTGPSISLCEDETGNIRAYGGISYTWTPSIGLSNPNISAPDVSLGMSQTYTVVGVDHNGCVGTDDINVTVIPSVGVDVSLFVQPSNKICYGDNIIFEPGLVNEGPGYDLTWWLNGTEITGLTTEYITDTLVDGDTVSVKLISTLRCAYNNPAYASVIMSVLQTPSPNIAASSISGCVPLTISFNDGNEQSNYYYDWQFGTSLIDNSNEHSPTVTYNTVGDYDIIVNVSNENGCSKEIVNSKMISIYAQAQADFVATPFVTTILEPEISFKNYSVDADNYMWNFGDSETSNALNPYHTYNNYGEFQVTLISNTLYNCADTATLTVIVNDALTLYVPTAFSPGRISSEGVNDIFMAYGTGIDQNNFSMYIYNRWGEIIFQSRDITKGWDGKVKGKDAKVDSYVWVILYSAEGANNQMKKTGYVTLIK